VTAAHSASSVDSSPACCAYDQKLGAQQNDLAGQVITMPMLLLEASHGLAANRNFAPSSYALSLRSQAGPEGPTFAGPI